MKPGDTHVLELHATAFLCRRRFFLKCEELLDERSKAKRETLARELKAKENINSELQGQTGQGEEPKDTSQDKARLFTVP